MPSLSGILLDVSGSMASSFGDGSDEEVGKWAQSIYTVISDLVEHDVSDESRIFSICFGGASKDFKIFDTIGTLKEIQDIENSDDTPASLFTIENAFSFLETHGARNICQWANIQVVSSSVNEHNANVILKRMIHNESFAHKFVRDCLPKVCRRVQSVPDTFQRFAISTVTKVRRQATEEDVRKVVVKAKQIMKEDFKPTLVSNESIFSLKQAAKIICGLTDEGHLLKSKARDHHNAVKPYIYGQTPLFSALFKTISLLAESQNSYPYHKRLLFIVSDGMKTDDGDLDDMQLKLKEANITVVCCYISSCSEVAPRTLHSVEGPNWEYGARFLFKLSSTIATQLITRAIFIKQGWNIDITNNETKLFIQVNHPDHLRDACSLARNIVYSQDTLADLLASVSLDIYINQKNTGVKAQNQVGKTCYANASAAVLHLAMHRVVGRTGGYPDFKKLRDDLINDYGSEGADTFQVLRQVCPTYRLNCREVTFAESMKAVAEKRPVVAKFRLTDDEWENFGSFYRRNPTGILRKEDLNIGMRDTNASTSGHAVVLTSYNSECLHLMNSWGEVWADNGFFRVEHAEILGLQFIDVYWTINDLFQEELEYFRVNGSEVADTLMRSLIGLQVAEYDCPICKRKSKVTSFSGSLSIAICPRCKGQFSCQDGKGNILALNMYLTSLSR